MNSSFILVLLPIGWSIGILGVLLLIFARLRRYARFRELGLVYVLGTLLLVGGVLVDGEGLLPAGWLHSITLTATIVCWGYIFFDLIEGLFFEGYLKHQGVSVPRLARDVMRGLVLTGLVLFAINQVFGVPLNSVVISSTVISAVIGLALQDLLKNVVAGIALQVEQPFRVGDWITVSGQTARVIEMSWRATRMVSVDNTHTILPNATLAQANIDNYTITSPVQAMHVQVALSYQHPPNQVKEVLVAAALAAEGVLKDPRPRVRLIQYGDYSITYDIKFWLVDFENMVDIRDSVMTNAWYFVHRAGLRMPFPIRDVYVHQADSSRAIDEHRQHVSQVVHTLAATDIFSMLSEQALGALAACTELRIYGTGELLVRQGDTDDSLFIIRRGRVRVDVYHDNGQGAITVNRLEQGDFFGEMALLTGAPRGATVIAESDTEALLVHREGIAPLLINDTLLPERLGGVLARRLEETREAIAGARVISTGENAEVSAPSLVSRIRSLFGLG